MRISPKNILYLLLLQVTLLVLSFISFKLRTVTDSLLLYLPLVMGIVFIHWFGPRILPVLFINGYTTLMIYGVKIFTPLMWFISIHEAAVAFTSWLLYAKLFPPKNTAGFADTSSYLRFVLMGMVVPVCVNSIFVYHYGTVKGDFDKIVLYWLSDFITILPLSTVLLHFVHFDKAKQTIRVRSIDVNRQTGVELIIVSALFVILSLLFPFDKYW
ncbi:MAG TPA: hypothetical protein VFU05_05880, partial [Cyclobacteriaceae bacterium]|nr:hypothetical protein [Cyclobacteriaceae bacterium]